MSAVEKPEPIFQPNWELPPLFFLHIPKTAGSSNNEFLKRIYGAGNFHSHTENILPDLTAGRRRALRVDCISGHIPLWAWHLYPGADAYARVTLLRDPWARVVSHINWVNLYNHGLIAPRHGPGAEDLAQMIDIVGTTDFEDRRSLVMLLNHVRQRRHFSSFDNYQVRMLRQGAMDAMDKALAGADVDAACDALSGFFHVGFCEDQTGFQAELLHKLQLSANEHPARLNPGRCRILTTDNDLAREVLSPWFERDQALVGYARGLIQGRK